MYSLDINFLKDRHLETSSKTTTLATQASGPSLKEQLPLIIGGAVMVVLPAITASSLLLLNHLSSSTEQRIQQLDNQLGQLSSQNQSIEEINAKVEQNNQEIQSLVTVFNQIRPWSAILNEIETQIPANVQVGSIVQNETEVTIGGYAMSYDALNDFLLTLQSSPLLKAEETVIQTAALADFPVETTNAPENVEIQFPQGVKYTIITAISDRPSSELLQEFARSGAIGLVNRIRTLENQGVLKP
ncbi:PilN domain-containing protein [Cyanothece sp. BG0011]|uniref:PilN domain-containing protein n=1 Tax=Cyanothece sp. BG0011 TaxID=2082950 RepID=UPI000D1D9C48|nr:PilN domain-containing protein [Cyanothece sp. BG0011]